MFHSAALDDPCVCACACAVPCMCVLCVFGWVCQQAVCVSAAALHFRLSMGAFQCLVWWHTVAVLLSRAVEVRQSYVSPASHSSCDFPMQHVTCTHGCHARTLCQLLCGWGMGWWGCGGGGACVQASLCRHQPWMLKAHQLWLSDGFLACLL